MSMAELTLLLTCEHGGKRIPTQYTQLFATPRAQQALASHRGYDLGALPIARALAKTLRAPLYYATISRLLVDLNRSLHHRRVFSEFSQALNKTQQAAAIRRHYLPHREAIRRAVAQQVAAKRRVCHIAVHSFTPTLKGQRRNADIGLLYDPQRRGEANLCQAWQQILNTVEPTLRVRRNYPYRGNADGLTTELRKHFSATTYIGIELEINQALIADNPTARRHIALLLIKSLRTVIA